MLLYFIMAEGPSEGGVRRLHHVELFHNVDCINVISGGKYDAVMLTQNILTYHIK